MVGVVAVAVRLAGRGGVCGGCVVGGGCGGSARHFCCAERCLPQAVQREDLRQLLNRYVSQERAVVAKMDERGDQRLPVTTHPTERRKFERVLK